MAELPAEPIECKRRAESNLPGWQPPKGEPPGEVESPGDTRVAIAWALLAVAGELAEIRHELRRRR
jgi:hypothetical protein